MIFRKSLSKKKGAAYSFFSALSSGAVPALTALLGQSAVLAGMPLMIFTSHDGKAEESMKFIISGTDNSILAEIFLFALGIVSIVTAVVIFCFTCDKRTVNVYYSLGIKRTSLFSSKYFAGAFLLAAATAVSVVLSYIVNLIFVGSSWQLSLTLFHFYCGLSIFELLCFSATVLVFSSVGTVSEAVVYSVSLLWGTSVFFSSLQRICSVFLSSSAYGVTIDKFGELPWQVKQDSMVRQFSRFNPLLFFEDELVKYSCGELSDGSVMIDGGKTPFMLPNLFMHLPWFLIVFASAAAAILLFRRLKAENCGFLNTNKLLSNIMIFELCVTGSTFLLTDRNATLTVRIAVGVISAFVLYLAAEAFLKRSLKKILRSLYKFAAHMAAISIICTAAATGGLGYGAYIPAPEKIQTAGLAVPIAAYPFHASDQSYNYTYNVIGNILQYPMFLSLNELPEFTEKEDIDALRSFHKRANEAKSEKDGNGIDIFVRYTLRNGKNSRRRLHITDKKLITELFSFYETAACRQQLKNLFYAKRFGKALEEADKCSVFQQREETLAEYCFEYETGNILVRPVNMMTAKQLKLTENQFLKLKAAVFSDLCAALSREYFTPSTAHKGFLSFELKADFDSIIQDKLASSLADGSIPPGPKYNKESALPLTPEEAEKYSAVYGLESGAAENFRQFGVYAVGINDSMTKTLKYLSSIGLADCFEDKTQEITSVSFVKNSPDCFNKFVGSSFCLSPEFSSYTLIPKDDMPEKGGTKPHVEDALGENTVTDTEKINGLLPLMRMHAYTFGSGYFCFLKYATGPSTVLYLPEENAPDYVKNYQYNFEWINS